jgi:alkyl sulfatase BDS1-like metallo-beta-lactamase superfamily hydrolase
MKIWPKTLACIFLIAQNPNIALANIDTASKELPTPRVNAALAQHMRQFAQPNLVRMSDRVWMAQGYDYSNFAFIEGETSIIVVDCGWFTGPVERALADLRKITKKPIGHIIYTHGHGDHVGGVGALTKDGSLPIYGHKNYERYRDELVSSRLPFILRRSVDQMGPLLTDSVGTGIGIVDWRGKATYFPPNILLEGGESLTIDGVRLEIINAPSDIDDEVAIWLPSERVLFVGDAIGNAGPYASTPRNEHGRDPYAFVSTLDRMLDFPAEAIVAGHGRAIKGREESRKALLNNRDIIQFLIDSVVRAVNSHTQRDVALAELKLPDHLANDPDLQWHYHSLNMVWRGIYSRLAGWYGDDPIELLDVTPEEQARHMVDLAGGTEAALRKADDAYKTRDFKWSAMLANHVLKLGKDNAHARSTLTRALMSIAYDSASTSQRNYLLSEALALNGKLDRSAQKPLVDAVALFNSVDNIRLLESLTTRVRLASSLNTDERWLVKFKDEPDTSIMTIRQGVGTVKNAQGDPAVPKNSILIDRPTMVKIILGQAKFSNEILGGRVTATDVSRAALFFSQWDVQE